MTDQPVNLRPELDALWNELIMDALASDGAIRDSDVKDAVARWRPRIEATEEALAQSVLDRIEKAIQEQIDDPITAAHYPEAVTVYRNALGVVRSVRVTVDKEAARIAAEYARLRAAHPGDGG